MPSFNDISRNISQTDKEMIKNITSDNLKKSISNIDMDSAAKKMRQLGFGDAADKLTSMSKDDLLRQISANPQILDKLKTLFK